jgi:parallel beta-helix repeat protein
MLGGISAWQSSGYPVWIATVHNVNTTFNYDTIQAAIDAPETLDGHTIFVDSGTYYENVIVNKSVSLVGENRSAIVDGHGIENILAITRNNVTIAGFTLRNAGLHPNAGIHLNNTNYCNITKNNIESGYYGILFEYSSNNTISGNTITSNTNGIYVESSFNNNLRNNDVTFSSLAGLELRDSSANTVSNNDLRNNDMGISLRHSSNNYINGNLILNGGGGIWIDQSVANLVNNNTIAHNQHGIIFKLSGGNTLRNNNLTDNAYNFGHYQTVTHNLSHLINDIDPSNTISKKPIYYWVNQHNKQIPADASYVAIINSTNILVESLNLTQNPQDVLCAFSNNVTVKNLTVSHASSLGILLLFSSNSTIANNSITNSNGGVGLWSSDSNVMINNTITFNFGDGIDLFY